MDWESLLSTEKLSPVEPEPTEFDNYPTNEFEKDYNRIVSSAAFRRLQDKTQVFPLDKSDFIRTRLTHSIEVSTIARQLGIMISKNKTPYRPTDIDPDIAEGISSVLLCAGLLHDLGNPPFGHFGETTIGDWFKSHLSIIEYKKRPLRDWLTEQMAKDLENFEGNAQALRILAKAKYGSAINLSCGVISTLVKYPTNSCSFDRASKDIKQHKLGYFTAEEDTLFSISQTVGTVDQNGDLCRHPLTFMLEAADDIAYATADLEDAFKKRLFSLDSFIQFFENSYDHSKIRAQRSPERYSDRLINDLKARRSSAKDSAAFSSWLNHTRRWLMYVAVFRFSSSYKEIMSGAYQRDLFDDTYHQLSIKILKDAMPEFVFDSSSILKLELSSQTILSFLLDRFINAALYYDPEYEDRPNGYVQTKANRKYMSIFSENYKQDYEKAKTHDEQNDLYLRLLMVTDFISGMTDSYARTLYRELSGIE